MEKMTFKVGFGDYTYTTYMYIQVNDKEEPNLLKRVEEEFWNYINSGSEIGKVVPDVYIKSVERLGYGIHDNS